VGVNALKLQRVDFGKSLDEEVFHHPPPENSALRLNFRPPRKGEAVNQATPRDTSRWRGG
jgi:hypothetical protein